MIQAANALDFILPSFAKPATPWRKCADQRRMTAALVSVAISALFGAFRHCFQVEYQS